ncbi:Protein root UVB sensitive 5 [Glycine soja]
MEDMEKMKRVRPRGFQFLCSSEHSSFKDEDGADNGGGQVSSRVILVERYSNGDDSQLQAFLVEEDRSTPNRFQDSHSSDESLSWLPEIIKDFVLPAGFPGSVSDDYLDYMLLQFPTNVTGWICHTLVTSSLLKAVGIGSFTGTTAAASAAAIRWVSKDGIGAVGRLFIGGRFGSLFDDDPKQWRMYADFIGSAGSIFDLTTQLYPAYFLPLASLGNLTKAVARGLKDPSFRVIQNHFAISGNLGEVAAKEEVWEVVAQLVGLSLGILILDTPGLVKSYGVISLTWLSMRLLHLWLRYESLSVLQFNTINIKRARILVKSHVLHSTVPGCTDSNREVNILAWSQFMKPKIIFGLPLEKMDGVERSYFMVGATNVSVLRSVWQSFWLSENWDSDDNVRDQIATSLMELEEKFEDFIQKLKDAEWDTQQFNLKVLVELSYFREVDAHLLAHLSQKARNKWDFMEDSLHKSSDSRSIPTNERMHEQPEPIIVLSRRKSFNEKVVVVSGETGCGKTTQLPQYILESEIEAARGAVLVGAVVL